MSGSKGREQYMYVYYLTSFHLLYLFSLLGYGTKSLKALEQSHLGRTYGIAEGQSG